MKILDISLDATLNESSAASTHTFALAENFSNMGHEVLLVIRGPMNHISTTNNLKVLQTKFEPLPQNQTLFRRIISLIIKNILLTLNIGFTHRKSDLIYERHSLPIFSGLILSAIYRVPLFYEVNEIPYEHFFDTYHIHNSTLRTIIFKVCRFQLNYARAIFVQTNELKLILERKLKISNVHVVENGTHIPNLDIDKQNSIFTLIYVGALNSHHQLDEVFESITSIPLKFKFLIIGDGEFRHKYTKKYAQDTRFKFLGELPHSEISSYISSANVCIASYSLKFSLFEKYGFYFCPLKLLEYSAHGKPTVLFGLSNSVIHRFEIANACFVVKSKIDFSHKIETLIADKNLVKTMGDNARKLSKQYTWLLAAQKTLKVIEQS